jgi:outer membrane murein-binding lipoprotein Lpp
MERLVLWKLAAVTVALWPCARLAAQETTAATAAAIAEKQYAEERYKRLQTAVEDLQAAQVKLQKQMEGLADELQALREERARAAARTVTHDDLKKLWDRLQELDRKREEDKRLILEEIRRLATPPVVEPPPKRHPPAELAVSAGPQKGYEYEIQKDDTLGAVVAAYQKKGVKVTLDQVLKANPNLKPKQLRVGQKVFIPDPALR